MTATGAAPAGVGDTPVADPTRVPGWVGSVEDASELALFHPAAWPLALAGFLFRGGLAMFVLPIVVLPTVTGLATALGPVIILLALAGTSPAIAPLVLSVIAGVLLWLVVGGLIGAFADVALVRWFGAILAPRLGHLDDRSPGRRPWGRIWRTAVVRALAHLLLVPAGVWAAARIVAAIYREVTTPGDVAIPLFLRVVESVPDALLLLGLAWLVGEAVGALAIRWLVLGGRGVGGALAGAARSIVVAPLTVVLTAVLATASSLLLVAPPLIVASWAWEASRRALLGDPGPGVIVAPVVLAVVWCAGLALAGLASAWRSALWTAQVLRTRPRVPSSQG